MKMQDLLYHRPMIIICMGFLFAILCTQISYIQIPFLILLLFLSVLLILLRGRIIHAKTLMISLVFIIAILAGTIRVSLEQHIAPSHISNLVTKKQKISIRGRIASPLMIYPYRDAIINKSPPSHLTRNGHLRMEVESINGQTSTGSVRVTFYGRIPDIHVNDIVRLQGTIRPVLRPSNPGQFDYASFLAKNDVGALMSISAKSPINVIDHASLAHPQYLISYIRSEARTQLFQTLNLETASYLSGLLLGYQEPIHSGLSSYLRQTGTAHFMAISGFHLAVIYGILCFLFLFLPLSEKSKTLMTIGILLFYTFMTGSHISVIRSFILITVFLTGSLIHRKRDTLNSLALAALIIFIYCPSDVYSIGFLLSFSAVLGIIYLSPLIYRFVYPTHTTNNSRIHKCLRYLTMAIAVSVSSWMATAPITMAVFHMYSPIAILANLLIFPLITISIFLGFSLLFILTLSSTLAAFIGSLLQWIVWSLEMTTKSISSLPYAYSYTATISIWSILLFYTLLILWMRYHHSRSFRYQFIALPILIFILPLSAATPRNDQVMNLTMLDVADGSAYVVEHPDGTNILYDVGSKQYRDPGRSVIAPYLWSRGIQKIDYLILSHADSDHVNGIQSIIERFTVGCVLVPARFTDSSNGTKIIQYCIDRSIPFIFCSSSTSYDLPKGVQIMAPMPHASSSTTNDSSLVIRISYGTHRILLPGDIQNNSIKSLLDNVPDLNTTILAAPHHGRHTKWYNEFASRTHPDIVLVSARQQSPSKRVLNAFHQTSSAKILHTALTGAVSIHLTPNTYSISTFQSK